MAVDLHKFASYRSVILFGVGLAGIIYETVFNAAERPTLLVLFAGMMGTPLFLKNPPAAQPATEKPPTPPPALSDPDKPK